MRGTTGIRRQDTTRAWPRTAARRQRRLTGVSRILPQISARMSCRLLPAGLKSSAAITSGAPRTTSGAPCAGQSIACWIVRPPTACTGIETAADDRVEFVHRAEALDHASLVEADVVDDEVDAESFHPARAGDAVGRGQVVAHHLHAVFLSRLDRLADRRLVRAPHDHDEVGARLRHHLGLQVAAVHDLEVGDDRMIGKAGAQPLDAADAMREDERRARLEPVDAGVDGDLGRLQRLVERRQVERDLDDRKPQCVEARHR